MRRDGKKIDFQKINPRKKLRGFQTVEKVICRAGAACIGTLPPDVTNAVKRREQSPRPTKHTYVNNLYRQTETHVKIRGLILYPLNKRRLVVAVISSLAVEIQRAFLL